jgi:hypothetical protein
MTRPSQYNITICLWQALLLCLVIGVSSLAHAATGRAFDHLTTGFELDGQHRDKACESCHVNAVFKGTPRTCEGCHAPGSRIAATMKSATHVLSSDNCGACHATSHWSPATRFTHDEVRGACASCHNGVRAAGKSINHIATNTDCGACHRSSAWLPAGFNHDGVTGNCFSCHNGAKATGKNAAHITSSNSCEFCHRTTAWKPATKVDHTQLTGSCSTCHNGTIASGKNTAHIASDMACDACHTTTAWKPVIRVDHAHITGSCSSCHNGVAATGKTASHVQTTAECGICHSTLAWKPAAFDHANVTGRCDGCHGKTATGMSIGHMTYPVNNFDCNYCHNTTTFTTNTFMHKLGGGYPGDHRVAIDCTNAKCHSTNIDAATWNRPADKPDCAGCHYSQYKSDPHVKYGNTRYSADELKDCSGSCHEYTDSTLTVIRRTRNGPQHRLTSSQFGG